MRLTAKFFPDHEVACKGVNCGCGNKVIFDPVFDSKLFSLRVALNEPMVPTSGSRCKVHNDRPASQGGAGGSKRSFHISDHPQWSGLKGTAAIDIRYKTIEYRDRLAKLAWEHGFRIGYNKGFLHLDSAAHCGVLPQIIFKYDNVSDAELEAFRKIVTAAN